MLVPGGAGKKAHGVRLLSKRGEGTVRSMGNDDSGPGYQDALALQERLAPMPQA